ncbi:MAG TPA: RidA family protein [Gemmataceae bacterium]|nr:RidA family protein [Gemmataceae bacterium]
MKPPRACCRVFTACGLLGAGVLIGLLLPRWFDAPGQAAQQKVREGGAEDRLRQLKLDLPPTPPSKNTLVAVVRVGDLLFVSGHGPTKDDGSAWVGRLGQNLDVKEGRAAARRVGLHILRVVRDELGSLDKVVRVVKTLGMVNATPDFTQHPQVVNGFSDLMVEVFGDKAGKGTRSAVGMSSLPGGIPVEIEAIFQVRP